MVTVVSPGVVVNYSAALPVPLVVTSPPVAAKYALKVTSNAVAANYQAANVFRYVNAQVVRTAVYRYIDGKVVQPGLYRYIGGVVQVLVPTPDVPSSYPPNYGAVGAYWPGPTTTGIPAGTTLTTVNGNVTTTGDGQIVEDKDILGNFINLHQNVILQRCKIQGQAVVPSTQAANIILVDCTNANVQNFLIRDCEVVPRAPSQWSVGIDGHDWTRERCNFHDLQDNARLRNRSTTEDSFIVSRQNWGHDFTWFQVAPSRATSEQTHCDDDQAAGARGFLIEGDNMEGYFGPNGQKQPTLTTNTSTAWANETPPVKSATTAPELAGLMLNGSGSQVVSGITVRKCRFAGFVTPINMGDPLLASANIGTIIQNVFTSDSPAELSNPPKQLRQQPGQIVDWGQDDPARCNRYADGPKAGQEMTVRYDASSSATAPIAGFTGTPVSGTFPLPVGFASTATGLPTSYAWTFGDGGTSTGKNPLHTYTAAGTYTVAQTVSNAGGTNTMTRTSYVTVTAPSGTTRPSGAGYKRYEDLVQPGDTVTQALARLTTPDIVTFPQGRFECVDFNTGFQAGITVPPICRGIVGSGSAGVIGSSTGTVFTIRPNSSTAVSKGWIPAAGSGTPNQTNLIKHNPASGNNPTYSDFRMEGTPQGHSYHGLQIVGQAGTSTTVRDLLITGIVGTSGVPPEETFSLQVTGGTGTHLVQRVEVDGRQGGSGVATAAVGITVQFSVGALVEDCVVRYCRAAAFVAYRSYNTTIKGGIYDSASAGTAAVGNGGLNFEQTDGSRIIGGTQILGRAGKVHITHSNGNNTLTVGATTYSAVGGSLELLDVVWNALVANGYLYIESWAPYFEGGPDINTMHYPGALDSNGASITGTSTAPWVHNTDGSPIVGLLWILGQTRTLNPTPGS